MTLTPEQVERLAELEKVAHNGSFDSDADAAELIDLRTKVLGHAAWRAVFDEVDGFEIVRARAIALHEADVERHRRIADRVLVDHAFLRLLHDSADRIVRSLETLAGTDEGLGWEESAEERAGCALVIGAWRRFMCDTCGGTGRNSDSAFQHLLGIARHATGGHPPRSTMHVDAKQWAWVENASSAGDYERRCEQVVLEHRLREQNGSLAAPDAISLAQARNRNERRPGRWEPAWTGLHTFTIEEATP